MKPHYITASNFKPSTATEVPLTSYMRKVAKLLEQPKNPLILPSEEVNTDTTADKSLSETTVQHVADTQHVEKPATTADATKGLDASESAEEQGNQPKTADAGKVQENIVDEAKKFVEGEDDDLVTDSGIRSLGNVTFDGLYRNAKESPYEIEYEIKVVKRMKPQNTNDEDQIKFMGNVYTDMEDDTSMNDQNMYPSAVAIKTISGSLSIDQEVPTQDSDLESMLEDEVESAFGFNEAESIDDENDKADTKVELLKSEEATANNVLDEPTDMDDNKNASLDASADKPSLSDPLGHLQAAISSLYIRVEKLESSLAQQVADKLDESVPQMHALPAFDQRVQDTLKAQVPEIVLKPLNREFNALNKAKSNKFENKDLELTDHVSTQGEPQPFNTTTEPENAEDAMSDAQEEQLSEQAPQMSTALVV
ncbi:hypothetical protein Tco_1408525 [Tanacetum coccineum]